MKYILFFFLLLFSSTLHAEPYDARIKTDKDGNIYVLSIYKGKVVIGDSVFGDSSSFNYIIKPTALLAKFNANGTLAWADTIMGINQNCFGQCPGYFGMAVDKDNNIIISMSSYDTVVYRQVKYYQPNLYKLDTDGNVLWTKQLRDTFYNSACDVAVDDTGNIYYGSSFYKQVISDQITLTAYDTTSIKSFVAKVFPSGITQWMQQVGSPLLTNSHSMQELFFVTADAHGNAYLGGTANESIAMGNQIFTNTGFFAFMAKIDSTGAPGYIKGYKNDWWMASTANSCLMTACTDTMGRVYLGGSLRDTVEVAPSKKVITSENTTTPFIARVNATGDAEWYQYNKYISPLIMYGNNTFDINAAGGNELIAMGTIHSTLIFYANASQQTIPGTGNESYWIRFDSVGNLLCYHTDTANLLAGTVYKDGYFTVSKRINKEDGDIRFASIDITRWNIANCAEDWRYTIDNVFMVPPINVQTIGDIKTPMVFFPNPSANGVFYKKMNGQANIFDVFGKKIAFTNSPAYIDISQQPKGIYIYKFVYKGEIITGKLLYQ